ncbi:MAG: polyprenol monophosphomannose synthase [Nanoarchaeota archaeon]|nr:polyprenol monophosphomannose synthase [Nanoarchaeota archaeon]
MITKPESGYKMTKCAVILPTYNERENIETLIKEIFDVSSKNSLGLSIVVVDDNSPDGTAEIVKKLMHENFKQKLFMIERPGKMGLGTAYIAGFRFALEKGCDYAITMDADFSHRPNYLPAMLQKMETCDLCVGSRYVVGGGTKNWGITRKIISRSTNLLAHTLLGLKANDCTAGFRCYKKEVLNTINLNNIYSNGYSFLLEMMYKCQANNFKVGEIPIIFEDRRVGVSKISRQEIIKAMKTLMRFTWRRISGVKE